MQNHSNETNQKMKGTRNCKTNHFHLYSSSACIWRLYCVIVYSTVSFSEWCVYDIGIEGTPQSQCISTDGKITRLVLSGQVSEGGKERKRRWLFSLLWLVSLWVKIKINIYIKLHWSLPSLWELINARHLQLCAYWACKDEIYNSSVSSSSVIG